MRLLLSRSGLCSTWPVFGAAREPHAPRSFPRGNLEPDGLSAPYHRAMEYVLAAVALIAGVAIGWLWANARAARERAQLAARHEETAAALRDQRAEAEQARARVEVQAAERARALEEQRAFLEQSRAQVQDAFARLSQEALAKNSQVLLDATSERLAPVRQALEKLESKTLEIEKSRAQAYGSLEKHLLDLSKATTTLRSSNDVLVTAFKGSMTARGRFGEIQLKNLVEAAGMLLHCDFVEQEAVEGGVRPDMVIRLPEGDGIPIDAKLPLSAYWTAAEATDPEARKRALRDHADLLRRAVRTLSKRDYSQYVKGRIDYVVLFLPADPILSAAYEVAPEVLDEAVRSRVLIATPVTFLALLSTSKILWNQRALAENALEIQKQATELYKRVVVYQGHVAGIGDALNRATNAFNQASRSYQTRVLPAGRRVEELGGASDARERLDDVSEIELVPAQPPREPQPSSARESTSSAAHRDASTSADTMESGQGASSTRSRHDA